MTLWRPAPAGSAPAAPALGAPEGSTGSWRQLCALRGHADDVQDLAWAPCGSALLSGSVDNQAIVWDVARRQGVNRLEGHTHYVQGVAWDPAGEFLVTQAGDRTARVWGPPPPRASAKGGAAKRCAGADAVLHSKIVTAPAPAGAPGAAAGAPAPPRAPMFHDENLPSFFRRLAWSPEGSVLAAPAGLAAARGAAAGGPPAQPRNVTWLFKRRAWAAPAAALPGPPSAGGRAVAVRFSPVLYAPAPPPAVAAAKAAIAEADAGTAAATSAAAPPPPVFALPYRMVFAVATLDHVSVYDTGDVAPLAVISALHFAAITDLAWSPDGNTLAVASADGFCSLVTFEPGELGEPLPADALPADVAARLPAAAVARAVAAAAAAAAAPQPPPSEQPPPQHAPPPQQPGGPRRIVPVAAGAPPADAPRRIVPVAVADPVPPLPAAEPAATSPGEKRPLDAAEASPAKAARTDDAAAEAAIEIE